MDVIRYETLILRTTTTCQRLVRQAFAEGDMRHKGCKIRKDCKREVARTHLQCRVFCSTSFRVTHWDQVLCIWKYSSLIIGGLGWVHKRCRRPRSLPTTARPLRNRSICRPCDYYWVKSQQSVWLYYLWHLWRYLEIGTRIWNATELRTLLEGWRGLSQILGRRLRAMP
jgi:hypothetical protein